MTKDSGLNEDVINELNKIGHSSPPEYQRITPILDTEQTGIAGEDGDTRTANYVGHVAYSPDFDCLVYQVEREQHLILHSVDGGGFSISKHIIESLRDKYKAEYVFGGMRETQNILVIPVDAFTEEWHTEKYDKQLYARLDRDVLHEVPNAMESVFTPMPAEADCAITLEKARNLVPD